MPKKISKSDVLDNEQEARTKHALENWPESQHFTKGTFVMHANKRGEILAVLRCKCPRGEKALRVRWEDDSVSLIEPFALNR
jgi:activator of HSP90 ATPase